MTTYYQAFIANEFTDAAGGDRRPVRNPATGAVWAEVPECGPEAPLLEHRPSGRVDSTGGDT
ncbi:hypothetical protein, partial [Marinovum algicola]|uniref:hypothetical protein n=1 Tax=Marinovum algicola TaxID=42444 RepID=UPI0024B9FD06